MCRCVVKGLVELGEILRSKYNDNMWDILVDPQLITSKLAYEMTAESGGVKEGLYGIANWSPEGIIEDWLVH